MTLRRAILIGAILAVWVPFNWYFIAHIPWGPSHGDWQQFLALSDAMAAGELYDRSWYSSMPWLWAPLFAPVMVGATWLGYWGYVALHGAALLLLWRTPWLIALALLSYAFWIDAAAVNVMTFAFVFGALAIQGRRWASFAYLALFLFVPKPVMLPLAVWLLWKQPDIRRPFLVGAAVYTLATLASGYTDDFIVASLARATEPTYVFYGPGAIFGRAWLIVGIPLAVLLTWKGYPGTAGWVAVPYMVETYWLMPLLDLLRLGRSPVAGDDEQRTSGIRHERLASARAEAQSERHVPA